MILLRDLFVLAGDHDDEEQADRDHKSKYGKSKYSTVPFSGLDLFSVPLLQIIITDAHHGGNQADHGSVDLLKDI